MVLSTKKKSAFPKIAPFRYSIFQQIWTEVLCWFQPDLCSRESHHWHEWQIEATIQQGNHADDRVVFLDIVGKLWVYPSSGHLNRENGDRWIWGVHHCQTSLICFVFGISCHILSRWVESCEVTAYDFPSGRFARQAGVELVLVGDSCGTQLQPDLKSSGQLFLFPLFFFSFFRACFFCSQSHKNPLFLICLNILNSWRIPCLSIKAFSNLVDHQRKANDRQLGVPEVLAIVGVALD